MTQRRDHDNNTPTDAASERRSPGARRFVLLFVILVIAQLTAYRYTIDLPTNDWYLFQVARHTAWVLGGIGHDAILEKGGQGLDPVAVRAQLGLADPTRTSDTAPPPLSAWERWQYRAYTSRSVSRHGDGFGPQVIFVLKPGIHYRLQELEAAKQAQLDRGEAATADPDLNTQLAALQEALHKGLKDPALRSKQRGRQFNFNVIPACGAIEVMAIFLAAVLAFPATWRSRWWGVSLGVPVLYLVNIFRLSCLAVIGALDNGGPWFTFVHEYVWQAIYVVFVVVLWLIWLEIFVRRRA